MQVYAGIDVCKAGLDVFIHPIGQKLTVGNDPAGLKRLKKSLAAYEVALVVVEATGKFHREAHRNLSAGGFAVAIVNPLRSSLFAEAIGVLVKTDTVDARMLAILGESLGPAAVRPRRDPAGTRAWLRCRRHRARKSRAEPISIGGKAVRSKLINRKS
jgi:transposase